MTMTVLQALVKVFLFILSAVILSLLIAAIASVIGRK